MCGTHLRWGNVCGWMGRMGRVHGWMGRMCGGQQDMSDRQDTSLGGQDVGWMCGGAGHIPGWVSEVGRLVCEWANGR